MNNKQYIFTKPFEIKSINSYLDEPQKHYITVRYLYCGICGGDYSVYKGRRGDFPVSLGHEFVGKVLSMGDDVTDFQIGEYVVSDFNYRCGKCPYCLSGKTHLCLKNDIQYFSNRAFAEYGNIHMNYLHKIPELTYLPKACLIEPLSCVIHACQLCRFTRDMRIVINGCGSIGMLFVFYLSNICSFDNIYIKETNRERELKILSHFPVIKYHDEGDLSFDYVIECTNSADGVKSALNICDFGGKICIMSHLYGMNTAFIYETICRKELMPVFPLRNGFADILQSAIDYIRLFWQDKYNNMIEMMLGSKPYINLLLFL